MVLWKALKKLWCVWKFQSKDLFANLQKIQCPIATQTFSNFILDKAIEFCTNTSDFYLDDSSLFVFQYNLGNKNLSIQFDKNQVKIFTNEKIHLIPGQILEIPVGFVSNIKALPDLSSDLCDNIALAPCVQFIPDLNIPTLYLANCTDSDQCYVPKDTALLLSLIHISEPTRPY